MPADLIQKLFIGTNTTADDAAAGDVPQDGLIESIHYDLSATGMDALDDTARCELSFASVNSFANNDSRISILDLRMAQNFLTSGGGVQGKHGFLSQVNIPVFGGERLHIHVVVSTGVTINAVFMLYYNTATPTRRRSARRR